MECINDVVLVDVPRLNEYEEYKDTGLLVPTKYRKFEHDIAIQKGTVIAPPSDQYYVGEMDLEEGDFVYTHHFTQEENRRVEYNDKDYVSLFYHEIYCKIVDDEIQMVGNWNFIEPIEETEEEVTKNGIVVKPKKELKQKKGIVAHMSKNLMDTPVRPGTVVYMKPERDYKIDVDGKIYYRVSNDSILAYEQ